MAHRPKTQLVVAAVVALGAAASCTDPGGPGPADDTAAFGAYELRRPDGAAPAGYRFAVSGTHAEECRGNAQGKCPTLWADDPAPNTCGANSPATVAYVVHQRGTDWNGQPGEEELHGREYRLAHKALREVTAVHDQSVIVQCCPSSDGRSVFAIKTCPDPCGGPSCPSTYGATAFGKCVGSGGVATDSCDLALFDAGWMDPHAPHRPDDPSGDDKRVYDLYFDISFTCDHDGVCSLGESCSSCPDDCADDCPAP